MVYICPIGSREGMDNFLFWKSVFVKHPSQQPCWILLDNFSNSFLRNKMLLKWWESLTHLLLLIFIARDSISSPGSFCPSPIPPSPGQPCILPGELECHYDQCCCSNCAQNFTVLCVPDNSNTAAGIWQMSSLCPVEDCGSEGEWWIECFFFWIFLLFS